MRSGSHRVDWEPHRHTIWQLYIKENKTLPVVMEIMKAKGLKATVKQFRYQIGDIWKFKKYGLKPNHNSIGGDESQTEAESDTEEVLQILPRRSKPENLEQTLSYKMDMLARLSAMFSGDVMNFDLLEVMDCDDAVIIKFIQNIFIWCRTQLTSRSAQANWSLMNFATDDDGDDDTNTKVQQWIIAIFLFLFDRLSTSSDVNWCLSAQQDFNTCPVRLLLRMSSLIVRVAISGIVQSLQTGQPDALLGERTGRDFAFKLAKRGVSYIDDMDAKRFVNELRQSSDHNMAKGERIVQRYIRTRHTEESPAIESDQSFDEILSWDENGTGCVHVSTMFLTMNTSLEGEV
ncbi:hypothetical protein F5Y18DRAFT_373356 [Xylariaceae sp. FL1019]|nr:hypothetical protein F5Y18DRAFT_373356 [Xylariaceae sp. FL1019]